ncbi:MAG: endonuclease III [Acidobacteria bacterium]|nr:endonuclease III [Acidobacteriota bacterium]
MPTSKPQNPAKNARTPAQGARNAPKPASQNATAPSTKPKRSRTIKPRSPERVAAILTSLRAAYPNVVCALTHRNAFELTIATILSAQTTDVNVNKVTPELFKLYPTPQKLAQASLNELETILKPTGFFRSKSKNIKAAAQVLVDTFHSKVPETIDELIQLPGVARKTANVVLGSWFGLPSGVVVDTHVLRLSRRLELTTSIAPENVEKDLQKIIPQDRWIQFSHELIHHGRQICIARRPLCADCTLEPLCNSADKTWTSH